MPRLAKLYFQTAIIFLIVGIGMGLIMAISGSHDVIGAHAHANLLGWVTMAIFGIYFALAPGKAEGVMARVQYGVYTFGVVVMTIALYLYLSGNPAMEPVVAVSSIITFIGVLLFAFILFSEDRPVAAQDA
ncbi:MAG: hypothetical protein MnENMB40S_25610 [Rhizobiaceae bacterium MnEN-MB40S]|nr:MAG: hypothetical protein MnENMB40S_25610 [Rhizobiaceae bacterium MnEN-MB40S]